MSSGLQIVHVLSTTYAGSHFLTLQLASHTQCVSSGEFHRFRKGMDRKGQECRICPSDDECPIHKGLTSTSVDELYNKLFANLQAYDPAVSTVIDNSKKIRWAERCFRLNGVKQKYIHLIRDPRALMRRWAISLKSSEAKKKVRWRTARRCLPAFQDILRGSEANVYLWKWLYQNKAITQFLARNALDARLVTYHDLVHHSEQILESLMNWLGHEYEPDQREYWRFPHHGSVKEQYMSPPKSGKRIFDQRWREFLTVEDQQLALNHGGIRKYLAEINVRLDDANGLIGLDGCASANDADVSGQEASLRA